MNEQKIYCGSGKVYGQYGQVGIDICLSDIPKEYMKKANNGKTYVKLNVCQKRAVDQYGNSHYVAVNTWQPNQQGQQPQQQAPQMTGQPQQNIPVDESFDFDTFGNDQVGF